MVELPTNLLTTRKAVNRHTAYMDSFDGAVANVSDHPAGS